MKYREYTVTTDQSSAGYNPYSIIELETNLGTPISIFVVSTSQYKQATVQFTSSTRTSIRVYCVLESASVTVGVYYA